ncbi:SLC13 family permease [Halobacterium hubeiense]|uniref:SLC13 family permease n=1 Tax=Halobacterium hubeiense TaxID=1407499 RepID=UPI000B802A2E|nr:DASS family sodium-coupled anion symporter [Halobacterium hubeiense]
MSKFRRLGAFALAIIATAAVALAPSPSGLSLPGQYALATMVFAGVLWVSSALPLPVTGLLVPAMLTFLGVYSNIDAALAGFSDHVIFLFIAGLMLANALQKYNIDQRIALALMARLGSTPRRLILAVMIATALLSMAVSNTATAAMMIPIAVGLLDQIQDDNEEVRKADDEQADADSGVAKPDFTNMQIAMFLGIAYAASVGGVGTLIGTPPNAIAVGALNSTLEYEIGFLDWLLIGFPVVVLTLPLIWYLLTFKLYPPGITTTHGARSQARTQLVEMGALDRDGRWVASIFVLTSGLWILGGLGELFEPYLSDVWMTTLFGGTGETIFGVAGHQGLFYYVLVGLFAIAALSLSGTMDWDELVDIDWGTILLFGGGISLADGLAETGATEWIANTVFAEFVGAPIILVIGVVVAIIISITNITSNTATTSIFVPVLISLGGAFASTLGLASENVAVFLSVAGAIAASFAFALPVSTPPNAIVYGSGYIKQSHMLRAGAVLNVIMAVLLTGLIWLFYHYIWSLFLF